ncbi:uncharacterized protein FIBRA_08995 [Fibroporia radiculosa]|uniref:Uncharacterized protein n=1 Tax=Fibroporia radiculosa TaxID=599839 RepID=J4ICN2_9APHY|nr:uncharacterized protein FIBRA_08995 [Fibroporia radiculosa]CCM06706.1 predicted protein [Fibroporia radiculosa]
MRLSLVFAALLPLVALAIPTAHSRSSTYEKDLLADGIDANYGRHTGAYTDESAPKYDRRDKGYIDESAPKYDRRDVGYTDESAPKYDRRDVGYTDESAPKYDRRDEGYTDESAPKYDRREVGYADESAPKYDRRSELTLPPIGTTRADRPYQAGRRSTRPRSND